MCWLVPTALDRCLSPRSPQTLHGASCMITRAALCLTGPVCAATDLQRLQIAAWQAQADQLLRTVHDAEALVSGDEPPQVQVGPSCCFRLLMSVPGPRPAWQKASVLSWPAAPHLLSFLAVQQAAGAGQALTALWARGSAQDLPALGGCLPGFADMLCCQPAAPDGLTPGAALQLASLKLQVAAKRRALKTALDRLRRARAKDALSELVRCRPLHAEPCHCLRQI